MPLQNRREFLGTMGAGLTVGLAYNQFAIAQSPGERIRLAVLGCGGQGANHARTFAEQAGCEVVAVCDVDPGRRDALRSRLPNSDNVVAEEDFRRILDDASIDAVSIASPDHWHTPMALAALQAGKHVYVEKPCSHTIHEAQVLARAADDSGLCVQHGTQARSGEAVQEAIAFLHDGGLGKVRMAKAINHQLRRPIGRAPESEPPEGVNYDLWIGPAPEYPFTTNRWHYNWHWFWDYGSGDIGNDGIHHIDLARWGLGVDMPHAVVASGAQLFYDDDHETPDTQTVVYEYEDCHLLYEMRLWTDYHLEGHDNAAIFYGDEGRLEIGRPGPMLTTIDGETRHFGPYGSVGDNVQNFLNCVREGRPDRLNAPMREAAISTALCYLGNIGTRLEQRLTVNPETWESVDAPEANAMYNKVYRENYALPEGDWS